MRPADEPTLSLLIVNGHGLNIRCLTCDREKTLSPLEAVASYGGLTRFSELRTLLWARCKVQPCRAEIGSTLKPYVAPSRPRPERKPAKA